MALPPEYGPPLPIDEYGGPGGGAGGGGGGFFGPALGPFVGNPGAAATFRGGAPAPGFAGMSPMLRRRMPGTFQRQAAPQGYGGAPNAIPGGRAPMMAAGMSGIPGGLAPSWMPPPGGPGVPGGLAPSWYTNSSPAASAAPPFDPNNPFAYPNPTQGLGSAADFIGWLVRQGGQGGAFGMNPPEGVMSSMREQAGRDASSMHRANMLALQAQGRGVDPSTFAYANLRGRWEGDRNVSQRMGQADLQLRQQQLENTWRMLMAMYGQQTGIEQTNLQGNWNRQAQEAAQPGWGSILGGVAGSALGGWAGGGFRLPGGK